jgi:hypothetical protein
MTTATLPTEIDLPRMVAEPVATPFDRLLDHILADGSRLLFHPNSIASGVLSFSAKLGNDRLTIQCEIEWECDDDWRATAWTAETNGESLAGDDLTACREIARDEFSRAEVAETIAQIVVHQRHYAASVRKSDSDSYFDATGHR